MSNSTVDRERAAPRPRVLLVDDHGLMRAGLRFVLEARGDLEVVGEASDGEEAVASCRGLRPDVVLMDITMPKMDGIEATRAIKAEMPLTAVLVLTSHVAEDVLMEAVRAGAAGYVLKGSRHEDVVGAVRAVLSGETPLDQGLAMRLLRRVAETAGRPAAAAAPAGAFHPGGADSPGANPLTPRETEVLRLLATGKTNRQLAGELHISLSTVKRHVERIIEKLGVSDRTQAAVRAGELGLLPARADE
jgi:DNA-binding NarL/FixJ family response regulator